MEQDLLQLFGVFVLGAVLGAVAVLVVNKVKSGSASPSKVRNEYDAYQAEVESHFEETSKKFKDMTAQYQDLYTHLSVGATSLCRPDSVAAALADDSDPMQKPARLETSEEPKVEDLEGHVSDDTAHETINESVNEISEQSSDELAAGDADVNEGTATAQEIDTGNDEATSSSNDKKEENT